MDKKIKISLSTFFLILAIIVIIIMGYFIYKLYTEKITIIDETEKLNDQINKLENQVNTLKENNMSSYNTNIINSNQNNTNENISTNKMSIELAYGILNKYKNENLSNANWYIGKVKLIAHGDNNTYRVSYEEKNLDGYTTLLGAIIEYKNGKWTTNLPGFSGTSEEEMNKYNFVNYNNEDTEETRKEMSIELAYGILTRYKAEILQDARWYITDVDFIAHGDNDTYLVSYSDYNLDGYKEGVATIIEYKNGKWTTDLPGFSGTSEEEMSKYNFVKY